MTNKIIPFNELKWIGNFFDNSVDIDYQGIDRIRNFVFLWNIFETFACGKNANLNSISNIVREINEKEGILTETYQPYLDYFANRYFNPNGDATYSIDGLRFRNTGGDLAARKKVEMVLTGKQTEPDKILMALLYILYRFRNNLFHGEKRVVELDTQLDNFIIANNLLSTVLNRMKKINLIG